MLNVHRALQGTKQNLISVINSGSSTRVLLFLSQRFEGSRSRCRSLSLLSFFVLLPHFNGKSPYHHFLFVNLPPPPPLPLLSLSNAISSDSTPLCLSDNSASCLSSLFLCSRGDLRFTYTHMDGQLPFIDVAAVCASCQCQCERCHQRVIVINDDDVRTARRVTG